MNEESLFAAALDRHDAAERRAFLAEACAGDDRLRRRVERLLAADKRAGGILDRASGPPLVGVFRDLANDRQPARGRYNRNP